MQAVGDMQPLGRKTVSTDKWLGLSMKKKASLNAVGEPSGSQVRTHSGSISNTPLVNSLIAGNSPTVSQPDLPPK